MKQNDPRGKMGPDKPIQIRPEFFGFGSLRLDPVVEWEGMLNGS